MSLRKLITNTCITLSLFPGCSLSDYRVLESGEIRKDIVSEGIVSREKYGTVMYEFAERLQDSYKGDKGAKFLLIAAYKDNKDDVDNPASAYLDEGIDGFLDGSLGEHGGFQYSPLVLNPLYGDLIQQLCERDEKFKKAFEKYKSENFVKFGLVK